MSATAVNPLQFLVDTAFDDGVASALRAVLKLDLPPDVREVVLERLAQVQEHSA